MNFAEIEFQNHVTKKYLKILKIFKRRKDPMNPLILTWLNMYSNVTMTHGKERLAKAPTIRY